jgi:hypothetical protein
MQVKTQNQVRIKQSRQIPIFHKPMSILIDDARNERRDLILATDTWRTLAISAEAAIEQALYYLDHHAPGRAREILVLAHERKPVKENA